LLKILAAALLCALPAFAQDAAAGPKHVTTGKGWFPFFRFYGPDKALFDKSWKLPDIEKVK
jgi:hypothetical protein